MRLRALGPAAELAKDADADVIDREALEEGVAADEVVRHRKT
jgi:hypothetical protein